MLTCQCTLMLRMTWLQIVKYLCFHVHLTSWNDINQWLHKSAFDTIKIVSSLFCFHIFFYSQIKDTAIQMHDVGFLGWPSLWRNLLTAAWTLRRPEELIKRRVTEIHQQAIVYLMMPPASPVVLLANKRPVLWSRDQYWPIRDQYSGHTEPSLHMRCIPDNWSLSASSSH